MSSGIWVISTLRARQVPTVSPTISARAMSSAVTSTGRSERSSASAIVAARASPMPTMPRMLPRRAVVCFESPASDRMNSSAAAM